MKYIEEKDNEINEYEIVIEDLDTFNSIIEFLDKKISTITKKSSNVTANSMNEAISKINPRNNSGVRVLGEVKNADVALYGQHMYAVEYFFRQDSFLSYILKLIQRSYNTNANLTETLDKLLNYYESNELQSIIKEMEENGMTEQLYDKYETLNESYQAAIGCIRKILVKKTINYTDQKTYKLSDR